MSRAASRVNGRGGASVPSGLDAIGRPALTSLAMDRAGRCRSEIPLEPNGACSAVAAATVAPGEAEVIKKFRRHADAQDPVERLRSHRDPLAKLALVVGRELAHFSPRSITGTSAEAPFTPARSSAAAGPGGAKRGRKVPQAAAGRPPSGNRAPLPVDEVAHPRLDALLPARAVEDAVMPYLLLGVMHPLALRQARE